MTKLLTGQKNVLEFIINFMALFLSTLMAKYKQQANRMPSILWNTEILYVNSIKWITWEDWDSKQFITVSLTFCPYLSPIPILIPKELLKLNRFKRGECDIHSLRIYVSMCVHLARHQKYKSYYGWIQLIYCSQFIFFTNINRRTQKTRQQMASKQSAHTQVQSWDVAKHSMNIWFP